MLGDYLQHACLLAPGGKDFFRQKKMAQLLKAKPKNGVDDGI